jgi:hypothetical protein
VEFRVLEAWATGTAAPRVPHERPTPTPPAEHAPELDLHMAGGLSSETRLIDRGIIHATRSMGGDDR